MLKKINGRKAKVGVIGLGYVGLPLAIEIAKAGFSVIGIDFDNNKIEKISQGESYIIDVKSIEISNVVNAGTLKVTSNHSMLSEVDIIIIAVPTPLSKSRTPDVGYIVRAMKDVKKYFRPGKLVILESTTYPGTTKELIVNELELMGFKLDKDFFTAFSPERVDPGNPVYNTKNTPKVVGCASKDSSELAVAFYSNVVDTVVPVSSCEEAEMCKLLENTFRAVNIGFVNELAIMCDKMNINIWNVIEAAKTKPFGYMAFYPGPGIGGHCIPLDPVYLSWKAKHYGFLNRSIELATDINENMPDYVVNKLLFIMNKHDKLLKGSKVLMLGVAYKNDTDDPRESPALVIYEKLVSIGARLSYYDPYINSFMNKSGKVIYGIQCLSEEILHEMDVVILTTAHSIFDYSFILSHSNLIFDTRNAFKNFENDKIVLL